MTKGTGCDDARPTPPGGIRCTYGLRYGRLSDPGNPRSAVARADGRTGAAKLTDVPVFPQLPSRLERVMGPGIRDNPQEDAAFHLNVWAPEAARGLPVLVFLHGGAWVSGGGSARWYRGEALAAQGLVVVTVNYRLGPAGHLEDRRDGHDQGDDHRPAGDLLAALDWVRRNIGGFGGDPARVTLAGQSAGAWYAWALAGHGAARRLFQRVALLSIPEVTPWTPATRRDFTRQVEARGDPADTAALLRAGAEVLAMRSPAPGAIPPMYLPVWPADRSGAATPLHVDALYVRVMRHEMSVFLPPGSTAALQALRGRVGSAPRWPAPPGWPPDFDETVALASRDGFGRFAEAIATAAEARGTPVIRRDFAALAGVPDLGAAHCFDLPFQFGNRQDWHDAPMLAGWRPEDFVRLSRIVMADLADFVSGRPQAATAVLGEGDGPHANPEA